MMRYALAAAAAVQLAAAAQDFGIGINLGNTLDAPTEGSWAPAAQEWFFDSFKKAGFTSVRIPVRWANHTGTAAPFAINATFLDRVEQIANWSVSRGFNTIINSHHDDWQDTSDPAVFNAMLPRYQAIWAQVAARFADWPSTLAFESFNEPHIMSVDQLNTLQATFYDTVRPAHPTRTLLLGGLAWMGPWWILQNPDALAIPGDGQDPNIMIEVHDYDPFEFTTPPISIPSWGTPADIAKIDATFSNMTAWAKSKALAGVVLGEYACSVEQSNSSARMLWYSKFSDAADKAGFAGRIIWDDDGWFKTLDRQTGAWDEGVLAAIGL